MISPQQVPVSNNKFQTGTDACSGVCIVKSANAVIL